MAVVERKRKRGIVYYVVTSVKGVKSWEKVGSNKREAETLNRQRRREVKEGTFTPDNVTAQTTVATFAARWIDGRKNRAAENERRWLELHLLPLKWFASLPLGDVRPKHLLRVIAELRAAGKISEKSISLAMGVLSVMFRDAVIQDVIATSPYVVPRGSLKRSGEKREPYTSAEAVALMTRPAEALWLAWNHVAFYTGERLGEICGLRWGDWDDAPRPMGSLTVERQYDGLVLKTERPRIVPVHPELRARLLLWRDQWEALFGHAPRPNNLMFPSPDGTAFSKSSVYKAWLRSCKAAEVKNRSVHSTRHTFITFARRGGADREVVELVTHNPKGTIVDRYTTRDWTELCQAVAAVTYVDAAVDAGNASSRLDGSSSRTRTSSTFGKSGKGEKTWGTGAAGEPLENGSRGATGVRVDASQPVAVWALALAAESAFRRATLGGAHV